MDKHLQLAAFSALREAEGVPIGEQLRIWNARYPQWAYRAGDTTHFGFHSRQAKQRLTGEADATVTKPEREYTAGEIAIAIEEKTRQLGVEAGTVSGDEILGLLKAAEQRANAALVEQFLQVHESGGDEDKISQWAPDEPQFTKAAEARAEAMRQSKQQEVEGILAQLREARKELAKARSAKSRERVQAWIRELEGYLERADQESPYAKAIREANADKRA